MAMDDEKRMSTQFKETFLSALPNQWKNPNRWP